MDEPAEPVAAADRGLVSRAERDQLWRGLRGAQPECSVRALAGREPGIKLSNPTGADPGGVLAPRWTTSGRAERERGAQAVRRGPGELRAR
jgi:hypothetical protein